MVFNKFMQCMIGRLENHSLELILRRGPFFAVLRPRILLAIGEKIFGSKSHSSASRRILLAIAGKIFGQKSPLKASALRGC